MPFAAEPHETPDLSAGGAIGDKELTMQVIAKRKFFGQRDQGTGRTFSNLAIEDCLFHWCTLSETVDLTKLARVRDVEVRNCRLQHPVVVGPSVIRDVLVENLEIQSELVCWHPLLWHVTLRGRIGRVRIEPYLCIEARYYKPAALLRAFEISKRNFYNHVDWALDIREAQVEALEIQGVPWNLIRRDPESQMFISRRIADSPHWCDGISPENYWIDYVEERFMNQDIDRLLLVAPKAFPSEEYAKILHDLHELREAQLTEPD